MKLKKKGVKEEWGGGRKEQREGRSNASRDRDQEGKGAGVELEAALQGEGPDKL